jgi:hypothetical protein
MGSLSCSPPVWDLVDDASLVMADAILQSQIESALPDNDLSPAGNLLNHQNISTTSFSLVNIPCHVTNYSIDSAFETDTQKRYIHLEYAKSFAEVPRSAL